MSLSQSKTSSDTSIASNGSSLSSLQNGPSTLSQVYHPHHQPYQHYDSLSASFSSSCQGVPRSTELPVHQPSGYSMEQVMPLYPVPMPGTKYMSDSYQTPLPDNQSEPIIQHDTSTTSTINHSCNNDLLHQQSNQQLLSALHDTLD